MIRKAKSFSDTWTLVCVQSSVQYCTPARYTVHSVHSPLITPQIQLFNFSCDENFPLGSDTIKNKTSNPYIFKFYFVVFIPTPSQFQFTIKFPEPIVGDAVSLHAITDQFCLVLFAQQNLNTFRQYFISLNLDRYFCSCLSY